MLGTDVDDALKDVHRVLELLVLDLDHAERVERLGKPAVVGDRFSEELCL